MSIMAKRREEIWESMYRQAVAYVKENDQMPPKSSVEYARILNWWKYNRKQYKAGLLSPEKVEKLIRLSNMRRNHKFFRQDSAQ